MTYYLYRHFDKDDNLIYAGISHNVFQRLSAHKCHSEWFSQITRVELEKLPHKKAALEAERNAIVNEKPLFNIQHNAVNPKRDALAEGGRYRSKKANPRTVIKAFRYGARNYDLLLQAVEISGEDETSFIREAILSKVKQIIGEVAE